MTDLPACFLSIPSPGDRSLAALRRKVIRLAGGRLLSSRWDELAGNGASEAFRGLPGLAVRLRELGEAGLEALGSPDVLTLLLAGETDPEHRVLHAASALRALVALLDRPAAAPGSPLVFFREDHPAVHLALVDTNPLAMLEEHPEKSGNALDLGGRTVDEWTGALSQALDLVRLALPTWYAELPSAVTRFIPVGYHAERHLSASYREAPGITYLTLHPDPLTMAEAIVHEAQHSKLNLLTWVDPVLHNGQTCWSESPVRPDLRPLMGVLLAAHAFVPVSAMHLRLAETGHPIALTARFEERRAKVLESNAGGLRILERLARPSPYGRRLLDELGNLHRLLCQRAGAPIPAPETR